MKHETPMESEYVIWSRMMELSGAHPTLLGELVEMGWIEAQVQSGEYLFRPTDAYRIRKVCRLCRDLGVSTLGASIIVDLAERIEHLERRVSELSRLL
jgi:chaperone modulatory protein CbpM